MTLQEDENRYHQIFDHLKNPLCIFNKHTREVPERNKQYSAHFNDQQKTADELFWHTREEYDAFMHQLHTDGSVINYETSRKSGDGAPVDLLISARPLNQDEILLEITDITEWKLKEHKEQIKRDTGLALASSSSIQEALKICLNAAIFVSGMDCGGIYLVQQETGERVLTCWDNLSDDFVKEISRFPRNEKNTRLILADKPVYSGYEELQSPPYGAAQKEGLRAIGTIPLHHKERNIGAFFISSRSLEKIPDSARNELELMASRMGDIIARIQREEDNTKSRADMETFFNSIPDIMFVSNREGQILYANHAASDCLDYPVENLLNMTVLDVHPSERRGEALTYIGEIMAGKRDFCPIPLSKMDGAMIPVETKVTPGRWRGNDAMFCISRDITEREKTKELLEKRDSILNAVSFAAHIFLQNDRWDEQIDEVLKQLGNATGVDRVYIFQNHAGKDGRLLCSQRFEWCATNVEPQIGNPELQNIDFEAEGFSRWIQILESGCVLSGNIDTFPEEEREILRSQGILSLVVVPVISDSRWWGYVGFNECKREREWSPTEIDALHVAADIFGSAIYQTTMKEVFKKPVEQSFIGTYLIYDGTFEYINPRFAEIFGYNINELIHTSNIEKLLHPEDLPLFREQLRRRLSGEVQSVHYEFRGISKTNETICLEAYGSVVEYRGKNAIVGNIMNITERKLYETELRESLDEKVVLLNEIHHRVKNNLQIISAFIELQIMHMHDETGIQNLAECNNQVLTMALIHESLYKSDNFTHISMKDHIENVTNTIGHSDTSSYDLDVEDIILTLDIAVPCSLVITEFINISQKYVHDRKDGGRIGISMHRNSHSRISLTLSDENVCLPADINLGLSNILELELIHTLVTNQLKGTIELQRENGMQLRIMFPEIQR